MKAEHTGGSWNGLAQAPDGRLLVEFPRIANAGGVSLGIAGADGTITPYPDARLNAAPATSGTVAPDAPFVGLNAIHLAPDGGLWAVDTGIPAPGKTPLPGGTRLIRIDLKTNAVTRVITIPAEALRPKSYTDDIRFNGDHAYVTDAGAPGLLVVDLRTGRVRRVLDGAPALTAKRPIVVDGETLKGPDGKPVMLHADLEEVTPDGKQLYVQPLCGPMSRIPTAVLDDPTVPDKQVAAAPVFWYDTPALGGTAIEADGTLVLNDIENDSVLTLSPDRVLTEVIRDPRLHWADAPVLAGHDTLLIPAAQLDRAPLFHHGRSEIRYPVTVYALTLPAAGAGSKPGTAAK
ncbi:MAG: hypothetical protein INR65_04515 [Gluconacetobacter diazotrophicus]|nr:hypothetical protein [Gluconacetobacter diazotrophicus]